MTVALNHRFIHHGISCPWVTHGNHEKTLRCECKPIPVSSDLSVFIRVHPWFEPFSKDRPWPFEAGHRVFEIIERSLRLCLEKFIAAGSRSYKAQVSFHGFRVSRRDVTYCYENKLFSWFGVSPRDMKCCGGVCGGVFSRHKGAGLSHPRKAEKVCLRNPK
jgi:hypothetical protein